jgi:hypothetical protein
VHQHGCGEHCSERGVGDPLLLPRAADAVRRERRIDNERCDQAWRVPSKDDECDSKVTLALSAIVACSTSMSQSPDGELARDASRQTTNASTVTTPSATSIVG